jgi:WXG100 family type VII secretion target
MFDETGGGGNLTQADTGLMRSAGIEAGNTAVELDQMLKNLMDNLDPLTVAWTGVAGTAFQNVKTAVHENMQNLYSALTSIAEDLGISSDQYQLSDEEIAADLAAVGHMDQGEVTRLLDGNTTEVSEAVQSGATPGQISQAMNTA